MRVSRTDIKRVQAAIETLTTAAHTYNEQFTAARDLIQEITEKHRETYDARSAAWQETDAAAEYLERLEAWESAIEELQELDADELVQPLTDLVDANPEPPPRTASRRNVPSELATHRETFEHVYNSEPLTTEQLDAIRALVEMHGASWKDFLSEQWMRASATPVLHRLRNTHGPAWLASFSVDQLAAVPVVTTHDRDPDRDVCECGQMRASHNALGTARSCTFKPRTIYYRDLIASVTK